MSAAGRSAAAPFAARTAIALVIVAVLAFIAYLLLSAYAPDFRPARNGGAHALSTSAVGFAGTTELVKLTRGKVGLIRQDLQLTEDEGLVVLTPGLGTDPKEIRRILDAREGLPTLIVLPKWLIGPYPGNRAWVRAKGQLPGMFIAPLLKEVAEVELIDNKAPGLNGINGPKLEALIDGPDGSALLANLKDTGVFILADPDAINNHGLATREGAERAMNVFDHIVADSETISFDLTLVGFGKNPNLLKLAFEPPFLPLTLCILFAALLAGWHAMRRFGPTAHEGRAIAFGKRAIVENGAALLRLAGRRHRTGHNYAALVRDAAASATGAPAGLTGDALDRYLDRLDKSGEPFSSIAERASDASDTRRLLSAARALYLWKRTVTREH